MNRLIKPAVFFGVIWVILYQWGEGIYASIPWFEIILSLFILVLLILGFVILRQRYEQKQLDKHAQLMHKRAMQYQQPQVFTMPAYYPPQKSAEQPPQWIDLPVNKYELL